MVAQSAPLLLRFEDRQQAQAVLEVHAGTIDAIAAECVLLETTAEIVEFEGEAVDLRRIVPGYYVKLIWTGEIPPPLRPYISSALARGVQIAPATSSAG